MATETPVEAGQEAEGAGGLAPGALMFAVLGTEQPERHAGLSALGREMAYTLRHAIALVERGSRAEPDPSLLLRGGEAAWLAGELDAAGSCYRAAAPQLVELAEGAGRTGGTSADYYRQALSAAWMAMTCAGDDDKQRAADNSAMRGIVRQMQGSIQRMQANTSQVLARLALEVLRVRGGWLVNDMDLPRYFVQAERTANGLDAHSKSAFNGGRDQLALTAIRAVVEDRPEQHAAPLTKLDAALDALVIDPPSVYDLMDEELVALQAASLKRGAKLPVLKLAPAAGSRVAELLPLVS